MALRFIESFEAYGPVGTELSSLINQMSGKWEAINTNIDDDCNDIQITNGAYTGKGLWLNNGDHYLTKVFDNQQEWCIGYWIKISSWYSNKNILQIQDNGDIQVALQVEADQKISVEAAGVKVNESSSLDTDTWYFFELYTLIQNDANGYYEFRIDGDPILYGNCDTSDSGNNYAQTIKFRSNFNEITIDDIYICDGQAGLKFFIGPSKVSIIYPNSDATPSNWTPSTGTNHYELVNDSTRNTSTYISTNVNDTEDIFGFTTTGAGGEIHGIQLCIEAASTGSEIKEIQNIIRFDSNDLTVNEKIYGGANTPHTIFLPSEYQVNTANNWTPLTISTADFGCKKVS